MNELPFESVAIFISPWLARAWGWFVISVLLLFVGILIVAVVGGGLPLLLLPPMVTIPGWWLIVTAVVVLIVFAITLRLLAGTYPSRLELGTSDFQIGSVVSKRRIAFDVLTSIEYETLGQFARVSLRPRNRARLSIVLSENDAAESFERLRAVCPQAGVTFDGDPIVPEDAPLTRDSTQQMKCVARHPSRPLVRLALACILCLQSWLSLQEPRNRNRRHIYS